MGFNEFGSWVGAFLSIVSIVSVITNVIQHVQKKDRLQEMKSQIQTQYNHHFFVARGCTKARGFEEDTSFSLEEKYNKTLQELRKIEGIADSSRSGIIAYSREHLRFTPFFEHPAYPGQEVSDEVKFGLPPEKQVKIPPPPADIHVS
ncbi:hypothetical protein [Rossellomorea aquimaris]|uniref:Uncharacterized protein n=1 Tax=Rossellomorea aquimaris TaxID=189382 RepID=A0A5D4TIV2_9BACI|nr:hypothetical protein [Rossellomorea aquimaris]TYS75740.1 hypothetical protein FZC80_16175 [Rossellomorea aquimaris]